MSARSKWHQFYGDGDMLTGSESPVYGDLRRRPSRAARRHQYLCVSSYCTLRAMKHIWFFFLLIYLMTFSCCKPCVRKFTQVSALHRHQSICDKYGKFAAEMALLRQKHAQTLKLQAATRKAAKLQVRNGLCVMYHNTNRAGGIGPNCS